MENLKENFKDGMPAGLVGGVGGGLIAILSDIAVNRAGVEGTEALVVWLACGGATLAGWFVVVWKANLMKKLEEKINGEEVVGRSLHLYSSSISLIFPSLRFETGKTGMGTLETRG